MDLSDLYTHSFIVKIWLEEVAEGARQAVWRGHITHVPSGERRYLKDLGDISDFIMSYLQEMGVKSGILWRIRQHFKSRGRIRWDSIDPKAHREVQ